MNSNEIDIHKELKKYFGFGQFKGLQEPVIKSILNKENTFVIMPTGGGKSLCYQLPALIQEGTAIVVSPLIALMKNQVDAIRSLSSENGIAHVLNSSLTKTEITQVKNDITAGITKLLYVAPESLTKDEYVQFLQSVKVSFVAIDEAHCISEWGHNFRPDYLKLPDYRRELEIPLVLLLTATATRKVKLDMAKRFDIAPEHIVQTGFYRPNLDLTVLPVSTQEKNALLVNQITSFSGAGIVYVTLQQTAETVARLLCQQGIVASAYHAGFEDEKRQQIQNDFMQDKLQVVVATIAFGMGIERITNLKYQIKDLRLFSENDIRFLKQFQSEII